MKFSKILIAIIIIGFFIRVWNISLVPPSLYWDEMDVGYQAYSILQTGKDYFGNYPGLVVHSFADFRAPLLIYLTIPFVKIFGLNTLAVRLPAALFGAISIFLIYFLSKILFKSEKISLVTAILMAFSPWSIQFSRMAFEANILLTLFLGGIICFFKGLTNSRWWIVSGIFFGLSLFAYNTAKLFIPLIILVLVLIYIRKKNLNKNFWLGGLIFSVVFLVGLFITFFQGGGQRFSEIAVWTDPQIESAIDRSRQESALSYADNQGMGMSPRKIDKVIYNKVTFVFDKFIQNYFKSISPDFLFINGDPNLRHSPSRIGELYKIELMTIIFGVLYLFFNITRKDKNSLFLLMWVVLAPIPAIITREGGTHATRLFLMFPALTIISSLGFFYIAKLIPKIKWIVLSVLVLIWVFSIINYLNYYFGAYKLESAKYFQYGFPEAVKQAANRQLDYKYVIIDSRNDSALMNFLFESKFNPADFQNNIPNINFNFATTNYGEFDADKLNNFYFMKPRLRDWYSAFKNNLINDDYLLIVSAIQLEEQTPERLPDKLTENQKLLDVIYYQDGQPAFYIMESKKPETL